MKKSENMQLQDFISRYDHEGSVVLLEGKREMKDNDSELLFNLGKLLTDCTKYIKFRSGNAKGSDFYFSSGVAEIDTTRLQVITPYTGHRSKENFSYETIPIDNINLVKEPLVIYQSKSNPKTEKHIDKYVSGDINRITIKCAYIIRDTVKVIGTASIKPATFAIFYDDLNNPESGGTGHTMRICRMNGINYINQTSWMPWL